MSASTEPLATAGARPSRWVWGAAALVVALCLSLAVACGDGATTAEAPTATPAVSELPPTEPGPTEEIVREPPPALTVTAGQQSIEAGLGSFCWSGLCADTIGPIKRAEPLPALEAPELEAKLASETIAQAFVTAVPTADLTSQLLRTGNLEWTGGEGNTVNLPATVNGGSLEVDISALEPGSYLLTFSVRFEAGGDASYGVVLDQGPLSLSLETELVVEYSVHLTLTARNISDEDMAQTRERYRRREPRSSFRLAAGDALGLLVWS